MSMAAARGGLCSAMGSQHAPVFDPWLWMQAMTQTLAASADPVGYGQRLRDQRLAALLAAAVTHSPFYRTRTGEGGRSATVRLADFEPVGKPELMQHFDAWATDRRITRASVDTFLADPARLGDAYLGDYLVWTSSGTSGEPGVFVQDAQSLAAFDALDAVRLRGSAFGQELLPAWSGRQRVAFVGATGGHFAGNASMARLTRLIPVMAPWLAPVVKVLSVLDPMHQLVSDLQAFQPTVLVTYPSCAAALAQAQVAGTLNVRLAEIWLGGEQLSPEQRTQVTGAFGCRLRNNYGASEFFSIAWECPHGHFHLNADWVILEPVDEHQRPVPAGQPSHSVLLTNLANHTQPLVRYDLGDRVRFVGTACECGSGFPLIDVEGRADDSLQLADAHGRAVTLLPLALVTAIEEGAQVARFQLLRTAPDRLELRFEAGVVDPRAAFIRTRTALVAFLARHGLTQVRIEHGHAAPLRQARSGKLRRVVTLPEPRRPGSRRRGPQNVPG